MRYKGEAGEQFASLFFETSSFAQETNGPRGPDSAQNDFHTGSMMIHLSSALRTGAVIQPISQKKLDDYFASDAWQGQGVRHSRLRRCIRGTDRRQFHQCCRPSDGVTRLDARRLGDQAAIGGRGPRPRSRCIGYHRLLRYQLRSNAKAQSRHKLVAQASSLHRNCGSCRLEACATNDLALSC